MTKSKMGSKVEFKIMNQMCGSGPILIGFIIHLEVFRDYLIFLSGKMLKAIGKMGGRCLRAMNK